MSTTKIPSQLDNTIAKKMPPGAWLMLLICVPVVALAVYFAPLLVSLGWHIMHGGSIDYRGLRVQVPIGWTADLTLPKDEVLASPQGITIEKQPKTLAFEARGPETMYFNLLLPDARSTPPQQAAEWKSLFLQTHPPSDFDTSDFDAATRSGVGQGIDCVEAIPRQSHTGAALACISLDKGWLANYAGSQQNVALFLSVASKLK